MNKAPPGKIRHLLTESFVIGGVTYYRQNMDCNCGALFFRPSKEISTEVRCPGCWKTFPVVRKSS